MKRDISILFANIAAKWAGAQNKPKEKPYAHLQEPLFLFLALLLVRQVFVVLIQEVNRQFLLQGQAIIQNNEGAEIS